MDDACHMRGRESVSQLRAQPENILLVGGASRHAVAQRDALNYTVTRKSTPSCVSKSWTV